jgi:glycosyltransferase involved in cell wall biosynthesis
VAGIARTVSVVIPARNAARSVGLVLDSLAHQQPPPDEVIVVDDASADDTAAVARAGGAVVIELDRRRFAGGARNAGWQRARGDHVLFLDADDVPQPGWGAGVRRAMAEHPDAVVGCARKLDGDTPWGWVQDLQRDTPRLARGAPRQDTLVPSYCLLVPRSLPIRFDESYDGEDALFCADCRRAGVEVWFDPRYATHHRHGRERLRDVWRFHLRVARGKARCGVILADGRARRILSRAPVHHFLLLRLPVIFRRVRDDRALRRRFLRLLPRLVLAEWMLGFAALPWVLRRPPLRSWPSATQAVEHVREAEPLDVALVDEPALLHHRS